MQSSWLALVPPLLVIGLAATTRRVPISIAFGIALAALIAHDYSPMAAFKAIVERFFEITELGLLRSWETLGQAHYLFICLFLVILGILISILTTSGAAATYSCFIKKQLKKNKSVEAVTLMMSHLFFVDDYFNSLTVGSVMRPIADEFRIPRVRLGLLINTMASPLTIMIPISSWVTDVILQLRQSGITTHAVPGALVKASSLSVVVASVPFVFYAFIQVFSLWFFVWRGLSFGIIRRHDREAKKTGNLFGGKDPVGGDEPALPARRKDPLLIDFIFPLVLLLGLVIIGVLWHGFTNMPLMLLVSGLITSTISGLYFIARERLTWREIPILIYDGFVRVATSILMLILLWMFGSFLRNDLATGHYLAWLLLGKISVEFLPTLFFLVGSLIAIMIGSSWGAFGILASIALPMLTLVTPGVPPLDGSQLPILLPLVGALISGSLMAEHFSPVSDIMLMSSISSGSYHIDLIKAQISYSFSGFITTALVFVLAGVMIVPYGPLLTSLVCLATGIGLNCLVLQCLHVLDKR